MLLLVKCSCGHTVDGHDALGCHDGFGTSNVCACRLSRVEAIDALVDAERREQTTLAP